MIASRWRTCLCYRDRVGPFSAACYHRSISGQSGGRQLTIRWGGTGMLGVQPDHPVGTSLGGARCPPRYRLASRGVGCPACRGSPGRGGWPGLSEGRMPTQKPISLHQTSSETDMHRSLMTKISLFEFSLSYFSLKELK